jgi:predicted phage terminase large subunit-like protein
MPHRVDRSAVEQLQKDLGSWMYAAQYQGRPVALEGNVVKRAWLRYHYGMPGQSRRKALDDVGILEDLPSLDRGILFTSTDCTFKDKIDNDFTVITLWLAYNEKFYLIDMRRGQWSLTRVCKELMSLNQQYRGISLHLIEKTANGPEIILQLQPYVRGICGVSPKGRKIARLMACTPLMEAGNVVIPHPQLFSWVTDELLSELLAFPNGERDDVCDLVSQALNEGNARFGAAAGFAGERAEMLL